MMKLSKKTKFWFAIALFALIMLSTIPLAIWVTNTSTAQIENSRRRCEGKRQATHLVRIRHDEVEPTTVQARLCDTLKIVNLDAKSRLIALGQHEKHVSYNGVSETLLKQGQYLELTLGHPGDYLFHDHDDENIRGTFSVVSLRY